MIRQCLAVAATLAMIAGVAPAQTANGPDKPSAAARATTAAKTKIRHHHKKPVETYEWEEDTWTETHPVKPPVVEQSTTIVAPPPVTTTTRTTTTVTER